MTKHIFRTEDQKKIVLDPDQDISVYEEDRAFKERGTDLYLHITKKNNKVFYLLHWTTNEHEPDRIEIVTEEEARTFFELKTQIVGFGYPTDKEIQYAQELWHDLFEETG
ncbi:MAG: hypothetical protein JTT12_05660 [Candidatus Brockarchaeota archaeon]|nr:hypothetical protein [Candidatus Brockarchaeota archaeon]